MGCCCSSNADDIYEDNATNDKSNLLGNPVGENSRGPNYFSTNNRDRSSSVGKIDEQAKLHRILQETAKNYIDVPAMNSPIDQSNYPTLEKNYRNKVQDICKNYTFPESPVPLLSDAGQIEQMLSADPLSESDRKMMKEIYALTVAAMASFQVDYTDSIIIPFDAYPQIP